MSFSTIKSLVKIINYFASRIVYTGIFIDMANEFIFTENMKILALAT